MPFCIYTGSVNQPIGNEGGRHIERDATCCFWHVSGSAEAAVGKLNMLPSNWGTKLLSMLSHEIFLSVSIFSRIERHLPNLLKKPTEYLRLYPYLRPDLLLFWFKYDSALNTMPAMNKQWLGTFDCHVWTGSRRFLGWGAKFAFIRSQ